MVISTDRPPLVALFMQVAPRVTFVGTASVRRSAAGGAVPATIGLATMEGETMANKKRSSKDARSPERPSGAEDWEAQEARWRSILVDQAERALELRSNDREFHGLEREFRD